MIAGLLVYLFIDIGACLDTCASDIFPSTAVLVRVDVLCSFEQSVIVDLKNRQSKRIEFLTAV